MKKIYLYFALLATVAVACSKDESAFSQEGYGKAPDVPQEVQMITETISGSTGSSTRVEIGGENNSFSWTQNDDIAVHVSDGSSHKYVFTSDEGAYGAKEAATTAEFQVVYEVGYSRDAFAVFPSSIINATAANYGQSGSTLDVTLPNSYTLDQVTGTRTPCPMIADNTGDYWMFYHLCGLLRLTINCIPPSTNRLEIGFNGKKVWGDFSVASPIPGTSAISTTDDAAHDDITITPSGNDATLFSGWGDGKVFNIPLPIGSYTNITVTAYNADGDAILLPMTRPFVYTASREHGVKQTVSFPVFSINTSRTKRVIFAPGNLQATTTDLGATWTWSFAEHQYDFIGNAGGNTKINGKGTLSENGTVDLFGWSSENTAYGIYNSTSADSYQGDFIDWGTNTITFGGVTYPDGYWRTLTGNVGDGFEWSYMMRTRSNTMVNNVANTRFALATINSDATTPVRGMILFPDYYSGPVESTDGITWGTRINDYGKYSDWGTTSCTTAGWETLENFGCVFLPAAGHRSGTTVSFNENHYASSTPGPSFSGKINGWLNLWFGDGNSSTYMVYWNNPRYKYDAASVRLAHVVN